MKRKTFIAAAVLFGMAAVVFAGPRKVVPTAPAVPARAAAPKLAYRPAGTVAFANLETIAQAVAGIAGPGSKDPVLTYAVPRAIRNQGAALLFGPMRPGASGVAVCYVEPTIAARIQSLKKPSDLDLDLVKRWTVVYPTALTKAAFMQRHPTAVPDANGTLRIPPGNHSRRTLWAWFAPDRQWAVLAPSPAMAVNAFTYSAKARAQPLAGNLAVVRMDADGARAVFGADVCAGGTIFVGMDKVGLRLRGSGRIGLVDRKPLPPGMATFAGVPPAAPLFGITTSPSDVRFTEDIFALGGPEFASYVKQALRFLHGRSASVYYLDGVSAPGSKLAPSARLARLLPESIRPPTTGNLMFCSPTTVMRLCLPKVAAKMMPFDSAKLQVALRMLRQVRGDGMALMAWREGKEDKFFVRISYDELRGTSNLWSAMLL